MLGRQARLGEEGSALAGRRAIADEDEAPEATDQDRGWGEVATAAAIEGAIFGGVKAIIDRAGATGFARATGHWPG